ncbi:MAG: protein-tyrosine phosphatase [Lentimonas sp.]|jgi:protein-tyrosine phosphatase
MSFLSNFLKKQELPEFDFSQFKVDMHSHLIPGIDDGSQSEEETLIMLNKFIELGYNKLITTPHIKLGMFDNTTEIIKNGEEKVLRIIEKHNLDIQFEAAAEYFFDFSFLEKIKQNDILSFGNHFVLLEYSFGQPPMGEEEMYFELQMKEYVPILAHFERYTYYHGSVSVAEKLRDRGVKIQLNLGSLCGHYGPQVQRQAELLIKEKQVDFVGTDCHRIENLEQLEVNSKHQNFHSLSNLSLRNAGLL